MVNKSEIDLDIDALAPPKIQVKFGGKVFEINPPTLIQYAKIIDFSQKIQKSNTDGNNFDETAAIYNDIQVFVKEVIPELKDANLNFAQLTAVYKLLAEIGAPTDKAIEKLKEQGINLKEEKKAPKASTS